MSTTRGKPGCIRRGLTLVVVMGLLAITLAISFAMLRWQATATQTRMNARRGGSARQAALMGLSLALRKMNTSSWAGADTTFTGTLSSTETYQVSYATGDPRLTSSSTDYAMYPYRVTVTSIGFAADPSDTTNVAQYTLRTVVQLVPKAVVSQPTNWSTLNRGTLYQWANQTVEVQIPCRVEGLCTLQGAISLASDYPNTSTSRTRYLNDLKTWKNAGGVDYRPFSGTVEYPYSRTDSATRTLISTTLGVTTTDIATTAGTAPLTHPGAITSYRLYTGGKLYNATSLPAQVTSAYRPDPLTNPLGICHRAGDVELGNNAVIEGMIVVSGGSDINLTGSNVQLLAYSLPALSGETAGRKLPTVLASDDFYIASGGDGAATGYVWVWDRFQAKNGLLASKFDLQGRLATAEFSCQGRTAWYWPLIVWSSDYAFFMSQSTLPYFQWYQYAVRNLDPKPLLTVRPDSSAVTYLWHDWTQPVFQAASGDGGLRWDLVDWAENP